MSEKSITRAILDSIAWHLVLLTAVLIWVLTGYSVNGLACAVMLCFAGAEFFWADDDD